MEIELSEYDVRRELERKTIEEADRLFQQYERGEITPSEFYRATLAIAATTRGLIRSSLSATLDAMIASIPREQVTTETFMLNEDRSKAVYVGIQALTGQATVVALEGGVRQVRFFNLNELAPAEMPQLAMKPMIAKLRGKGFKEIKETLN